MVASMIAVLKVGGSYVPIDVTYPDKRIEFIIKDAEVAAVLTYGKTMSSHIPVIKIEDIDNTENNKSLNIEYAGNLEDDLYHIYTSGTTGKPKAVSVKQRNILNLVCAWTKDSIYPMMKSICSTLIMCSMLRQLISTVVY